MAKYRKKPVVIEAVQWDGKYTDEIINFIYFIAHWDREKVCGQCGELSSSHGRIKTLEGGHIVCPGDWIITGVEGEKYPCKPGIFEKTYERVK